ncbi:aminotransferase class I/II-fold pyridoxal phosphate-dependent enzyme, partial [Proteus mirabilis]
MSTHSFYQQINQQLEQTRQDGLFKNERIITSSQSADIAVADGSHVINFCANNYLGLANHPQLIAAAKAGMDSHGFGMASVRFICGTQDLHKTLEKNIAEFLGMEDAILYSSCFDANGGLFETLMGSEDAIISDALNHASIIDGVRLCKAKPYCSANNVIVPLPAPLDQAKADTATPFMIATHGRAVPFTHLPLPTIFRVSYPCVSGALAPKPLKPRPHRRNPKTT